MSKHNTFLHPARVADKQDRPKFSSTNELFESISAGQAEDAIWLEDYSTPSRRDVLYQIDDNAVNRIYNKRFARRTKHGRQKAAQVIAFLLGLTIGIGSRHFYSNRREDGSE